MSSNQQVVIIGGGAAGITVAARLRRAAPALAVTVVEPAARHYYQPLWTLVGAGLARFEETDRAMGDLIPPGVAWRQGEVARVAPARREVLLADGAALPYDALVVAPGIRLALEEVEGLEGALEGDPRVWTNYSSRWVRKGPAALQALPPGGRALFTFPNSPIKCGGGPQKIMWVMEDILREEGRREGVEVHFVSSGAAIFGVPRYREALERLVAARGVHAHFQRHLVAVDAARGEATFEDLQTRARHVERYDLLHVTPPQRPFAWVTESGLGDAAGFVDVDRATLQHARFPEVFSAGDASSLPTGKTGAAVRRQAPALVANLLAHLRGDPPPARYDGYTSCPLVVSQRHVILAEFGYDGVILETFPFNQATPRRSMYALKRHALPLLYWHGMLKGRA
jgi:sulfide:quinone oxidoreductase